MEAPIYLFVDNHQLLLRFSNMELYHVGFSISTEILVQKNITLMFLLIVLLCSRFNRKIKVEYLPLLSSTYHHRERASVPKSILHHAVDNPRNRSVSSTVIIVTIPFKIRANPQNLVMINTLNPQAPSTHQKKKITTFPL